MKKFMLLTVGLLIGMMGYATDFKDLPIAAQKTILKYCKATDIEEIIDQEEELEGEGDAYYIIINNGKKEIFLTVSETGELLSKEEETIEEEEEASEYDGDTDW